MKYLAVLMFALGALAAPSIGEAQTVKKKNVLFIIADDLNCIALMARFIREKPALWAEDIAEA